MGQGSYAISQYPEARAILRQLDALVKLPPVALKRNVMQEYLQRLDARCARSKAMITEAQRYIPGGVQHNLSFNYPFPLVIDRAEGPYLYDLDGNRYLDFLQAGGPTVLESNAARRRHTCEPFRSRPACRALCRLTTTAGRCDAR